MAARSSPAGQGHGHCLLSTLLSVLTALRPAPSAPSLRRRELVDLGNSPFPWKPHVLSPCSRSRYHVLLNSSQAVQEGDSVHSLAELLAARRPQLASRVSVPYGERPLTPGAARADAVRSSPPHMEGLPAERVVCFRPLCFGTVVTDSGYLSALR